MNSDWSRDTLVFLRLALVAYPATPKYTSVSRFSFHCETTCSAWLSSAGVKNTLLKLSFGLPTVAFS